MQIRQIGSQNFQGHIPKSQKIVPNGIETKNTFESILQEKLAKPNLQYSKHVTIRMESLGIDKDEALKEDLEQGAEKARAKNIKEGLILRGDYGFVVSVKNNTVVTAMRLSDMQDNVFTNIDGAVIV